MDLSKESTFLLALCFADLMNDQADATLGNDVRSTEHLGKLGKLDSPDHGVPSPLPPLVSATISINRRASTTKSNAVASAYAAALRL